MRRDTAVAETTTTAPLATSSTTSPATDFLKTDPSVTDPLVSAGDDKDDNKDPDPVREAYLRRAQDVVDESNAKSAKGNDPVWKEMNADNKGVMPDNGVKPDAWKKGVYGKGDKVGSVHGAKTGGVDDVDVFRKQIAADLNFNGIFDDYKNEQAFVDGLVKRYGGETADRKAEVEHIARNLWSYGHVGTDVDGNTNVDQLQGMLFSLDPMIAEASKSNTKHEHDFTVPGSDVELKTGGDAVYGRATMLECRLLASVLKEPVETVVEKLPEEEKTVVKVELEKETKTTIPVDDDKFDRTTMVMDISPSMYDNFGQVADYMNEVDFGDTKFGGMANYKDGAQWHDGGNAGSQEDMTKLIEDLDKVGLKNNQNNSPAARRTRSEKKKKAGNLSDAFVTMLPKNDPKRKAIEEKTANSKKTGGPAADRTAEDDAKITKREDFGNDESALAIALEMLRAAKANPDFKVPDEGEQFVVATDEGDSSPQDLREVRDLANDLGIVVKVIYFTADSGVIELNINSLPDEVIDAIEAAVAGKSDKIDGTNMSTNTLVGQTETYDKRTGETNMHTKILWHRVAILLEKLGQPAKTYENLKERTSLRDS